jgi:recombination protein RecR
LPIEIESLVNQFSRLPGVGEKTALRQSLVLCNWKRDDLYIFSEALRSLTELKKCTRCGFFSNDIYCEICLSEGRGNSSVLCIVESVSDCLAIERSGHFLGKYHILGGVLNPLMDIGPEELGINYLLERISKEKITEVILAVNPSVEGDATCSYIRDLLPEEVRAERIGFGIPMGGNLEFLDSLTISKALENKKKI